MGEPADALPFVRVVVLNHNGGQRVLACLDALAGLDYPRHRYEVVVVDNASTDGSVAAIEVRHPAVELIRNPRNSGFGANNLAMVDRRGVDYVALCNDDAYVEPSWLRDLVDVCEGDPSVGAACPKMLFADRYVRVDVEAPPFTPGDGDPRSLGIRLFGAVADGDDRWGSVRVEHGCWDLEWARDGSFRWTSPTSVLWIPVGPASRRDPTVGILFEAPVAGEVALRCGNAEVVAEVEPGLHSLEVLVGQEPVELINNAGSMVAPDGAGSDRGFGRPDGPPFDEPVDVQAWCGGSVLLRSDYLDDVGLFHEPFFLYYEDTDLSLRGRARGWRYRYVPTAVARHDHSASSGVGSSVFFHYTERNRLLLLVRNAPPAVVRREVRAYLAELVATARREILGPLRRRRLPWPVVSLRRLRVLGSLLVLLPRELCERRRPT
ncbi:MAG: glycosyltransferase family 2 protein [Acidimicrobiia bacterium]|nr:glycosyltransferase family 2 protein [Acidimicrobiia bacterium]